jgi:hypothetical protein
MFIYKGLGVSHCIVSSQNAVSSKAMVNFASENGLMDGVEVDKSELPMTALDEKLVPEGSEGELVVSDSEEGYIYHSWKDGSLKAGDDDDDDDENDARSSKSSAWTVPRGGGKMNGHGVEVLQVMTRADEGLDAGVEHWVPVSAPMSEESVGSISNGNAGKESSPLKAVGNNKTKASTTGAPVRVGVNNVRKLPTVSSMLLKKNPSVTPRTVVPQSPKPFLRSSSSRAAARRLEAESSDALIPDPENVNAKVLSSNSNSASLTASRTPSIIKRSTSVPREPPGVLSTRRASVGPGTLTPLSLPSRTPISYSDTHTRRASLSGASTPTSISRQSSLSSFSSFTRSVDLSSAELKRWTAAASRNTPVLKASGRPSSVYGGSPSAPTSPKSGPSNYLKRSSPSISAAIKVGHEPGKLLSKPVAPSLKGESSPDSSHVAKSSPSTGSYKSPGTNGAPGKTALRKKVSPTPSLPRRISSFADLGGSTTCQLSVSASFSSPGDRIQSLSPNAAKLSSSPSFTSPVEKAMGSHKSFSSNGKLSPSLPISSASRGSLSKHGPSSLPVSDRPTRPSSPPVVADRGPSMLTRRKSSTPESRDLRVTVQSSPEGKAGDDSQLDLRGQKVRTLDISAVNLAPNMEFVYLRDHKLSTLNGIEVLKRVKVLDLSFNEFHSAGLEPLVTCKALQQLYLAGNQITSLSGLPQLPNLEFLSVAQNQIQSLAMASQPRLQVLAASKNKISSFKGFPHLPALEHLRLEENPILNAFHVEAQAILLVGPTLKKFNNLDISAEELELAHLYPASTALCIRGGWELCHLEDAPESTAQFLVSQWSESLPAGYVLKKAHVDHPYEEDPCRCEFLFEKVEGTFEDSELSFQYKWFIGDKTPANFVAIEGAESDMYWPKHEDVGKCLKVECSIILGQTNYPPVFAISSPVSSGTGCPKVLHLEVEGEPTEGNIIKGSAVVAWCGGTPGKSVSSWLRRANDASPVAIMGAEDSEYQLTLDDVGYSLIFMLTPVTEEGVKGEPQYAATALIDAAPPKVSAVQILGDVVEGNVICGTGKYTGGTEGASKFKWLRENLNSGEYVLVSGGTSEYFLTDQDVGSHIMFVYTPVNEEGLEGDPVTAITSMVLLAPPKVEKLKIVGDLQEGSKIAVDAIFTGGTEGASRVQWFKKRTANLPIEDGQIEPLSSSKVAKAFRIPLAAVGHYLVAKYTPVRSDGESGKPAFAISDGTVEMLPPGLTFLSIAGSYVEGETLKAHYGYAGGYEGASQYNWYLHRNENDPGTLVPEVAGQLQYKLTRQAVNKIVSFKCKPVREDGLAGEWKVTFGMERVRAGSPKLLSLHIVGEFTEGEVLQVEKEYWGGEEGSSKVQWFLTRPDGTQREIKGAVCQSYKVQSEDIGGLLCVSYEPYRSDGATGPILVSSTVGPVAPALPSCMSLEICGSPVEGGSLSFRASYRGGEKGVCTHEWVRLNPDGSSDALSTTEILDLTPEDVGCRIELLFTPVRKDGCRGNPQSVVSTVVADGEPEGIDLVIPQCFEDVEVVPRKAYFGGQEGEGGYTWYRTANKPRDGHLPDDAQFLSESEVYIPKQDDVGSYLVLQWVPVRDDGRRGTPIIGHSNLPVAPALPLVRNVTVREVSPGTFVGEGEYSGGSEGKSAACWYRQTTGGIRSLIAGANTKTYVVTDADYTCSLVFGYTPVRADGVSGKMVVSDPSALIYPELPRIQKLVVSGKPVEGETLTALEVIPKGDSQQLSWDRYKHDIKYQWLRSSHPDSTESFEPLPSQRACTYRVRLEDVGYCLRCECILTDVFGRSGEPAFAVTPLVTSGLPKVENLEIEGRGYHTSLYAVRGIYSGGKEGKSTLQWFRAIAGSPDLIPIPGEVGRMYEAKVDDVGYRLVAVYHPMREDGVEGSPVTASTNPVIVDPEVAKEVKLKLELGAVKFEALRDCDQSTMKTAQQQGIGSLERRILDVNRKRVKVIKPGSKTHFASTEIRGTYAPPFHVEVFRNDQHRLKIVIDSENEVDLMVQSRHLRDIIVLVISGFSQRFNSTPLNLLLKT